MTTMNNQELKIFADNYFDVLLKDIDKEEITKSVRIRIKKNLKILLKEIYI